MLESIHIIGSFGSRERLKEYRKFLHDNHFTVFSSWMDDKRMEVEEWPVLGMVRSIRDFKETRQGQLIILDTTEPSTTGGFWVELGIAIANDKKIWIVGKRSENPFTWYPEIEWFDSWTPILEYFHSLANQRSYVS